MSKRNRTKAQRGWVLRKLSLTRLRQKAWREQPEKMEGIRAKAIAVAKTAKDEKNQRIREAMSTWPNTLDTATLRGYILKDFNYTGKMSSLIWRMRRHGMMEFKADGLWHNLCNLPRNVASDDCHDKDESQSQGDSQRPDSPAR